MKTLRRRAIHWANTGKKRKVRKLNRYNLNGIIAKDENGNEVIFTRSGYQIKKTSGEVHTVFTAGQPIEHSGIKADRITTMNDNRNIVHSIKMLEEEEKQILEEKPLQDAFKKSAEVARNFGDKISRMFRKGKENG